MDKFKIVGRFDSREKLKKKFINSNCFKFALTLQKKNRIR